MKYFDEFADGRNVRQVVEMAMDSPAVQGVVFEIDPEWLIAWRIRESFSPSHANYLFDKFLSRFRSIPQNIGQQLGLPSYWIPSQPLTSNDLKNWRPPGWSNSQSEKWDKPSEWPIYVKICLRPFDGKPRPVVPNFDSFDLNIIYETRPRARLFGGATKLQSPLVGGVSIGIGKQDYGTMGGILKSDTGQYYGVTCGHVAGQDASVQHPAHHDSKKAITIGKVAHASSLIRCPSKIPCSWRVPGPHQNEVDIALIEIDPKVTAKLEILQLGKITGIRPGANVIQGMSVELTGRSSGHKAALEIGGNGKFYKIPDGNGGEFCFRNLTELKVPSFWANFLGSPVEEGDSGAWVCAPSADSGFDWCGMVIGGDRYTGYMIESETLEQWWNGPPYKFSLSPA